MKQKPRKIVIRAGNPEAGGVGGFPIPTPGEGHDAPEMRLPNGDPTPEIVHNPPYVNDPIYGDKK